MSSSPGQSTPSRSLSPAPPANHQSSNTVPPNYSNNKSTGLRNTPTLYTDAQKGKSNHKSAWAETELPSDATGAYEMQSMSEQPGGRHNDPLLSDKQNDRSHGSSGRPPLTSRGSHVRTRTPNYPQSADQTRRKYIYAAFFLALSLVSFVVQTETAVYIQHELHWNKAYCMLWLTHGSWSLLWPMQLLILRLQNRKQSWSAFWRRHKALVRTTAQMVQHQDLHLSASKVGRSPWPYMIKTTAYVTTFLTFAGASWYVAVDLTSPSDLTAIYNCSAFFAYVFSIWLLKDKPRFDKIFSVALAIAGVLVVAYGDSEDASHPKTPGHSGGSTNPNPDPESIPDNRLVGNLIIGVGSVLYGLYEVLYKRFACPPDGTSPNRGMIFANTFGSMVGTFTLTVLWIPLPILHFTGLEKFELPRGQAAYLLAISTLSNAVFSGSFLVLMSLTSPVLSSVAALLTIFLVAITDWLWTGKRLSHAALGGGFLIIIAFIMLSWATYREMKEEAIKRDMNEENRVFSDEDDDDDNDNNDGIVTKPRGNGSHAQETEALVDDDELDIERRVRRAQGRRSNSTVIIRGDTSDWEHDDDNDDFIDDTGVPDKIGGVGKKRHRNS